MSHYKAKLLIVDDEEFNRSLTARLLKNIGYSEFDMAENGTVALEKARENNYDSILLDIHMPGISGVEVLEELQKDMRLRDIPVIMISGSDNSKSVIRCIELGASDYLRKPIDPVLLNARLGACIETKRLRDQQLIYIDQLREEKERVNQLLDVSLPAAAANELRSMGTVPPRSYENVSMLFCDIVGFTAYCSSHSAVEVVRGLQNLFGSFEEITQRHGMEKIKTIGDEFMASAGLMLANDNPLRSAIASGLDMIEAAAANDPPWLVRVGINQGPVIAGIVGHDKYQFDTWGDTVNTAARMAEIAKPGTVAMPIEAWITIQGSCNARSMGHMDVKGKGLLEVVEVDGLR
jgi:adenylate cyclase